MPNRARFSHLLGLACEAARRDRRRFAVLFVDLDRFKIINDTLGHEAGDATLRAAAARLRGCVRASDVVARLGGDEFVVLLQDVGEPSVASKIAANVLKSLAEPVDVQGRDCTISASIGICLHPDGDQEDQAVLRNADMAMYLAKQSGKNGYRLYVNELERAVGRARGDRSAAARCARARASTSSASTRGSTPRRMPSLPSRRAFAGRTRSLRRWHRTSSPWPLKPAACSCRSTRRCCARLARRGPPGAKRVRRWFRWP